MGNWRKKIAIGAIVLSITLMLIIISLLKPIDTSYQTIQKDNQYLIAILPARPNLDQRELDGWEKTIPKMMSENFEVYILEEWSLKAPKRIQEGISDRLYLQCFCTKVADSYDTDTGPYYEKLAYIDTPTSVTVSGPFWDSPQTQSTAPKHPNPLEWSWAFTPTFPSEK